MKQVLQFGLFLAIALLAGCGKSQPKTGVKITGRVLNNGEQIALLKDETLLVSLTPVRGSGNKTSGGSTEVSADGNFELAGPKGTGIPAGSYEVKISSTIYGASENKDRFQVLFPDGGGDGKLQPIVIEITAEDKQAFIIDIGKRTATKQ